MFRKEEAEGKVGKRVKALSSMPLNIHKDEKGCVTAVALAGLTNACHYMVGVAWDSQKQMSWLDKTSYTSLLAEL